MESGRRMANRCLIVLLSLAVRRTRLIQALAYGTLGSLAGLRGENQRV